MRKLKTLLLTAVLTFSTGMMLVTVPAMADSASKTAACGALSQLDASQGCGSDASKTVVSGLVFTIVNILSLIVGVLAVIMIIVAGARYIVSGGDAAKVTGAKNTILYAIIGLIVALLAQFIIHFVLTNV